jgi:hypothetical protein
MPADHFARTVLANPERIFLQLNPCDWRTQDNCPSAAQSLHRFLNYGAIQPAYCPDPCYARDARGNCIVQGFIVDAPFRRPRGGSPREQLRAIIALVRAGPPGNNVVIHGIRPSVAQQLRRNGNALAPDHYASLIRLGPPENDVFVMDCSRPEYRTVYPSDRSTHPGGWAGTIEGYLLSPENRFIAFEYTRGPFSATPQPLPTTRSGGFPKRPTKPAEPALTYRPTNRERGLEERT